LEKNLKIRTKRTSDFSITGAGEIIGPLAGRFSAGSKPDKEIQWL
jgi:hypothetical protein